jgi:hypothetical protein
LCSAPEASPFWVLCSCSAGTHRRHNLRRSGGSAHAPRPAAPRLTAAPASAARGAPAPRAHAPPRPRQHRWRSSSVPTVRCYDFVIIKPSAC